MSSLLRRTSVLKLFFSRNLYVSKSLLKNVSSKHQSPHFYYRTLTFIVPKYDSTDIQEPKYDNAFSSIDHRISEIDREAKILGRVKHDKVKAVFEHIKATGEVTSIQCMYLIRSCGNFMLDVTQNKRSAILNEMWEEFQKLNVPMDASHFNSLLKVYIENEYKFVPTDFLSSMEYKGITPNRVTYQRLIDKYCEDADITGATTILDFMKEKGMAVNEAVFNSLIKCHAKMGDFEGARNIIEVMSRSNLRPSIDTYMALANGYIKKGDVTSVSSLIEEAKTFDIYFSVENFFDLFYSLAVYGHSHKLDWALENMANISFTPSFMNTVLKLLNKGLTDDAYKLLSFVSEKLEVTNSFYLFLRYMVWNYDSPDVLIKYCSIIKNKLNDNRLLLMVAKFALEVREMDYVTEIFNEMLKQGFSIRSHYFWPLFVKESNKKNNEGTIKILQLMCNLGIPADNDTFNDYVLPSLSNLNVKSIVKLIKETGHSDYLICETLFSQYVNSCDLKGIEDLVSNYKDDIDVHQLIKSFVTNYSFKKHNSEFLVNVIKILTELLNVDKYGEPPDFCGTFLIYLLKSQKLNSSLLEDLYNYRVEISRSNADQLCYMLRGNNPHMLPLIRNLQYSNFVTPKETVQAQNFNTNLENKHVRDMSVEELESFLEKIKQNGESTRLVLRTLLNHYCKNRNVNKILQTEKELDEVGFLFTPAMFAVMIDAFVSVGNLGEALRIKERLKNEYSDFKLDAFKVLDLATLLVRNNRLEDALEVIKSESANPTIAITLESKERRFDKLFNAIITVGDIQYLNRMCDTISTNFDVNIQKVSLLRPLIKMHLKNGDIDKAIDEYKHCVTTYRHFPCLKELMKECILNNDYEKLQKVVDITTTYEDKAIILHDLALTFIEVGQFQQAQKVFQELGGRINMRLITNMCSYLYQKNMAFELEQLLMVTKGFRLDRDQLYFYLLQLYSQSNDYEKALELWHTLQEENVQPSIKTLRLLAELLENNGQPIPFVVPARSEESANLLKLHDVNERNPIPEIYEHLKQRNFDKLNEVLKDIKKGYIRQLPPEVISEIVEFFAVNDELHQISKNVQLMSYTLEKSFRILRPLFEKFSNEGDVVMVKKLFAFLPDFVLKTLNVNYFHYQAFLVKERYEELLSEIESNIERKAPLFSTRGFLDFLKKAPHLEDKIITLVEKYATEQQFLVPKKMLWLHYFIQGKEDKANEIYKKHFELFVGFEGLAQVIMKQMKIEGSVDLSKRFINFISNFDVRQTIKDKVFCCALDVFVSQHALDEAVNLLKTSQEQNILSHNFNRDTLVNLQNLLKEKGEKLPFKIPSIGESSSSSDSD